MRDLKNEEKKKNHAANGLCKDKMSSNAGESLVEVLISVLVISLGLTMFATALMTSRKILQRGKNRMESYYAGRNALETENDGTDVALKMEEDGGKTSFLLVGSPSQTKGDGTYQVQIFQANSGKSKIWRYGR